MTDKKTQVRSTEEALKLALEALEKTRNALAWFYDSYPQDVTKKGNDLLPHVETVLAAIREALAEQPAQQRHISYVCPQCHWSLEEQTAQQQKRCHLCDCTGDIHSHDGEWRGECPYCKPAQQEQLREENERLHVENRRLIDRIETIGVPVGVGGFATTTTAQRTWVGLTDEELEIINDCGDTDSYKFARAIEAKLREKNAQLSKPLTDEEIEAMWPLRPTDEIVAFARAIEAAHGITGEQK